MVETWITRGSDMGISGKVLCLAACFVASARPAMDFDAVISAARHAGLQNHLRGYLSLLDAPRLVRRLVRCRNATPLDWDSVTVQAVDVLWDRLPIGRLHSFYKVPFPHEAQARIAYEVFLDRFLLYAQREYKAALIRQGDIDVVLFIPQGINFELGEVWNDFVRHSFTGEALRKGFVLFVNTFKLAERGIGTLDVPIANPEQAKVLAAFYRANLARLERSEDRRRQEIKVLEDRLVASGNGTRIRREITHRREELRVWKGRYAEAHTMMNVLHQHHPEWMDEIESLGHHYMTGLAAQHLMLRGDITAKAAREMEKLAKIDTYYELPPLLSEKKLSFAVRGGGDTVEGVCYACGRLTRGGTYDARKFIFESPSQRPQSGSGERRPRVCGMCALISLASPIKTGDDRLIFRMRRQEEGDGHYLYEEDLRMLTVGELNIVAGRYALMQVTEQVSRGEGYDPLPRVLGQRQYALYKVATLFPPEVFHRYQVEVLIGNNEVLLPSIHLILLRGLVDVFGMRQWWKDRRHLRAMGQAIRFVEKGKVINGVYALIRGGLLFNCRFYPLQSSLLETLYEDYWRWLMNENLTEARRFRDVAAMTGLLYAFCAHTRSSVRESGGNERMVVRKLVEQAAEPYNFSYTMAHATRTEQAKLRRHADLNFCFDQVRALIEELGVDVPEREGVDENGTSTLVLYLDDMARAYTYLFESRYRTLKDQREFANALRMSLHSRFPRLMERERGE